MTKKKYLVIIEKGEKSYSAFSPDVDGCIATGDTLEETIVTMKEALEFHIETLEEIPRANGLKYHIDSGTFNEDVIDTNYFIAQLEVELPAMA